MSPAKTAEPIEMPFGLRTRVGARNHVLHGVQIPHGKGNFEGKTAPIAKHKDFLPCRVLCKNAKPVDSSSGLGTQEGRKQAYSPGGANVLSWDGTLGASRLCAI